MGLADSAFNSAEKGITNSISDLNSKLSTLKLKLDKTLLINERIKLKDEIKLTENEIEKLNSELLKTEIAGKKAGTGLSNIGNAALNFNQIKIATEGVNQAFVDLTKGPVAFESSMKDLQAITGASGNTLSQIDDNARNLAKTFGGDATSSAESYKLILSKLSPELAKTPDVLDGMAKNAMLLSKTMGGDVVGATELLSAGMNQFSVDMSNPQTALAEMTRQMNIMSASAKEGSAEMPQIKLAVENVGAVAKQAGVKFESMNASIQILDKYGKSGAEGGIALRNVYSKLIKDPTDEVRAGLKQAGVDISVLQDKTIPFTDRMRELKKAGDDDALMLQMFGDENYLAAIALMNNADAQDALEKKIINTNTTQEQADIIMSSTAEKTKRLRAAIDDVKISLGKYTENLIPVATIMGENLVTVSQMAPALNLLKDGFLSAGKGIAKMAASIIVALIPSLGAQAAATEAATAAQTGLDVAMTANPIGAIVVAIAALVAGIVAAIVYFEDLQNWFDKQANIVKILIGLWGLLFLPIVAVVGLARVLIDNWTPIVTWFRALPGEIKKAFLWIVDIVETYNPFSLLLTALDKVFPGIKAKIMEVWNVVKEGLIDPIKNAIESVFDWLFSSGDKKGKTSDYKPKKGEVVQVGMPQLSFLPGAGQEPWQGMFPANKDKSPLNDLFKDKTKTDIDTGGGNADNTNKGISGGGSGKSLTMNLDIKNYFQVGAENMDGLMKKLKTMVTDVIVDSARDGMIIANQ